MYGAPYISRRDRHPRRPRRGAADRPGAARILAVGGKAPRADRRAAVRPSEAGGVAGRVAEPAGGAHPHPSELGIDRRGAAGGTRAGRPGSRSTRRAAGRAPAVAGRPQADSAGTESPAAAPDPRDPAPGRVTPSG